VSNDDYAAWVESYLDQLGPLSEDHHTTLVHGNIRGFAAWAKDHPFALESEAAALDRETLPGHGRCCECFDGPNMAAGHEHWDDR
jgi:hypothetical protein